MARAEEIQVDHVYRSKPLADGGRQDVLADFSLTVPAGQTIGVIGRSGGGKSTFLRLLNRLEDPDRGEIRYGGRDTRRLEVTAFRRQVTLVNQRSVIFPGTVLENVLLPDTLTGRGAGSRERATEMLRLVRLPAETFNRDAAALSVGQQIRVQLARVLYLDPAVLLLDESTANLDPKVAGEILDELHRLAGDGGLTILHVSHEPDKLRRCARLILIEGGRVAADGNPAAILDDPRGPASGILANHED